MNNKFFGSKFNTILLFILIILVGVVLRLMYLNKEVYLPSLVKKNNVENVSDKVNETWKKYPIDTVPAEVHNEDFKTHPDILGNKEDLEYFSIWPWTSLGAEPVIYAGTVKGGYFFEGNIIVNILDQEKKLLKSGHATATTNWMTSEPVGFEGELDLVGLPSGGVYYIEIHNDNASGLPENDKSILIPIIIN